MAGFMNSGYLENLELFLELNQQRFINTKFRHNLVISRPNLSGIDRWINRINAE